MPSIFSRPQFVNKVWRITLFTISYQIDVTAWSRFHITDPLCGGNPLVTDRLPSHNGPLMWTFDVYYVANLTVEQTVLLSGIWDVRTLMQRHNIRWISPWTWTTPWTLRLLHLKLKWQIVPLVLIRRLGHTLSSSSGIRDATLGSDLDLQVWCSVSNYINSSGNLVGRSTIISDTIFEEWQ